MPGLVFGLFLCRRRPVLDLAVAMSITSSIVEVPGTFFLTAF
jgi:hypothetical protein